MKVLSFIFSLSILLTAFYIWASKRKCKYTRRHFVCFPFRLFSSSTIISIRIWSNFILGWDWHHIPHPSLRDEVSAASEYRPRLHDQEPTQAALPRPSGNPSGHRQVTSSVKNVDSVSSNQTIAFVDLINILTFLVVQKFPLKQNIWFYTMLFAVFIAGNPKL